MPSDILDSQIGQAWRMERDGKSKEAIAAFNQVLAKNANHIDANYGMGMAQRRAGQFAEAATYFQKALEQVETASAARHPAVSETRIRNTPEDDRLMMLTRMLKQRIAESQSGR
jgi:cytochrome c-type biogenesis protein CcmH/NrfG